jgi:hypothetical protein
VVSRSSRRRGRIAALATVVALGATLLVSAGTAIAAKQPKVSVCHYDRTADAFVVLNVAEPSKHLAHGDTVADGRLAGKTVHALAYTDVDGIAGYAACGDNLIAALVEHSGDGVPSAGDKVLFGRVPTAFTAPFGFAAFPTAEAVVASVDGCDATSVVVSLGAGLDAAWATSPAGMDFFAVGDFEVDPGFDTGLLMQDNIGGGSASEFTDRLYVWGAQSVKPDEGGNPWLEVDTSGVCNS